MEHLNDIQFDILDVLYFVEPYEKILEEVSYPESIVRDELRNLLSMRLIQVMKYKEEVKDFVPASIFDSHNFRGCYFLATKEGLMKHNGR